MIIEHGFESEIRKIARSINRKPYYEKAEVEKYLRLVYVAAVSEQIEWCVEIMEPYFTGGRLNKGTNAKELTKDVIKAYVERNNMTRAEE